MTPESHQTNIKNTAPIEPAQRKSKHTAELPRRVGWLINGFKWYVLRYLRKNFHAVRLSKTSAPWPRNDKPVVVVMNHPSWWDPLIVTAISDFLSCEHYGAIDAQAVRKYPIFQKLGFFPVDQSSLRGAAEFLRLSELILSSPGRAIWITAQGRFTDVRTRPLDLRPGIGHLAKRCPHIRILPLALEYTFWTEKTPEALIRVGPSLEVADYPEYTAKQWTETIELQLTATLDQLNLETMKRDPDLFHTLQAGKAGVGGAYDRFRLITAWIRGRRFDPAHQDSSTTSI